MIKSMTGYGKAEHQLPDGKITIEIRSLNGKNADISIKTQLIPREKELEVRQFISKELQRGNIDLYANFEKNTSSDIKIINKDIFTSYYRQVDELIKTVSPEFDSSTILPSLLKLPDVIENKKQEFTPDNWVIFYATIKEAVVSLNDFRVKEGQILYNDIISRVKLIESYILEVEKYEKERIDAVKERLQSKLEELTLNPDKNRLEQEIIFYLEKLDINEEKVRLRQHCQYFMDTINNEEYPGRKIGFIAQEMGREINTMGSKANHAEIQKWVVRMKDELEKMKEQSLNIC